MAPLPVPPVPPVPPVAPPASTGRRCAAEILDTLPDDDEAARHCRRDLRRLNRLMGNARWFARTLPRVAAEGTRVLEFGAGGGELAADLHASGFAVEAIDRAPQPESWPADARWHQLDLFDFKGWEPAPVVIGNLIFHHFDDAALRTLGREIDRHATALLANEPVRRRLSQRLLTLACRVIGAHPYTRHDAAVSIHAGFRGEELPQALGLEPTRWRWRISTTLRGAYRLVARRLS